MTETHDPQADAIQQEPVVEGNASPQSEATEAQVANDIQASYTGVRTSSVDICNSSSAQLQLP